MIEIDPIALEKAGQEADAICDAHGLPKPPLTAYCTAIKVYMAALNIDAPTPEGE